MTRDTVQAGYGDEEELVLQGVQPAINTSGDVFYTATIALPQRDPALRWGMTVKIEFK